MTVLSCVVGAGVSNADPSAPAAATGWPSTWPAGPYHTDWSTTAERQPEQGTFKAKLAFTDGANKHHDISMTSVGDMEITELTFDGQKLNTIPQYRQLSRYLQAGHMALGAMQSDKALACTHPDDDDASNLDGSCAGAHNKPSYPANLWTQGSPTARTVTPKLDYSKPENWPSTVVTLDPWLGKTEKAYDDQPYEVDMPFIEKATGRRHRILYNFMVGSGKITKLSFDGSPLTTVAQYRALYKWFTAHPLTLGYRGSQTLECTRATEDNAIKTNPDCAGWTGPW